MNGGESVAEDQVLIENMFGTPTPTETAITTRTTDKRNSRSRGRGRNQKVTRAQQRKNRTNKTRKKSSRVGVSQSRREEHRGEYGGEESRKQKQTFLPRLGGGGQSVPELNASNAWNDEDRFQKSTKKKKPYMSSKFDMARQPFMKSAPVPSAQQQAWERMKGVHGQGGGGGVGWTNDRDTLKKAGKVMKTNLPSASINTSISHRDASKNVFDQNCERMGQSWRSGKDYESERHVENKSKGKNKPYVLPMKVDMSVRGD